MVVHRLGIGMVVCSDLVSHKLSFLFAKILFGVNVKGHKP